MQDITLVGGGARLSFLPELVQSTISASGRVGSWPKSVNIPSDDLLRIGLVPHRTWLSSPRGYGCPLGAKPARPMMLLNLISPQMRETLRQRVLLSSVRTLVVMVVCVELVFVGALTVGDFQLKAKTKRVTQEAELSTLLLGPRPDHDCRYDEITQQPSEGAARSSETLRFLGAYL